MNQIPNPILPYNGPVTGGVFPGKVIRIHGSTHHHSQRFAVNLLCGPMGDIALHVSPNFHENHVIRNSVLNGGWGHPETHGHFPLHRGQPFNMSILVDPVCFKVQFNNMHFADFHHRTPFSRITNISIEGDIMVSSISYEMSPTFPGAPGTCPPYAGSHMQPPGHIPSPHYPGHQPSHYGAHPPAPGMHYPPSHTPGYPHSGMPGHYMNKKEMKKHRKAEKKALKYGLGAAGVGVGAYALHKGMKHHGHHGHHRSSSSSSSSSSSD